MRSLAIIVILTLSSLSTARADEVAPPPPPPPAPPGATPAAAPTAYPEAMSDRAYNLDKGMVEIHGAMPIFALGGGSTDILAGIGVSYGISDALEIGADYAFEASPKVEFDGLFAAHARLRVAHTEQVSASLGVAAFYSKSFYSDGITLLAIGASVRYRINKQLSLFTESNACGGCINVVGPVMGQGIIASGGGDSIVGFTVPVGVGLQATPQVYLSASTVIGAILLSPQTDSYFLLRDAIPVVAGAWFAATPKLDLGASITDDLKDAGNNYFFELGVKARL
jgi:hypothetical protein